MRIPARSLPIALLALLLAACRAEEGPQPAAAEPRPAEDPRPADADADTDAALAATGSLSYKGTSPFFCLAPAEGGVQVDFRTGNADLPAVALRISVSQGNGPFPARVFVTGRSLSGALVTSVGAANVNLRRLAPSGGKDTLLGGSFRGWYDGGAGKGAIEGRFGSCNDSEATRGGSPPAAGPALPEAGGRDGQPAGTAEETP
ncbi:MAG TPA: hypothetical protein VGH73_20155 [Thermoanaerobaculia bacterium]